MKSQEGNVRVSFGHRLKELRLSLGLTQEAMAYALGIQQARYNKYEIGRSEAPYEILIKISRLTKVSLDELIGGEPNSGVQAGKDIDELIIKLLNAIPIPAVVYDREERLVGHNKAYAQVIFDNRVSVLRPGMTRETLQRTWAYSKGFSSDETERFIRQHINAKPEREAVYEAQIGSKFLKLAESRFGDYRLVLILETPDLEPMTRLGA